MFKYISKIQREKLKNTFTRRPYSYLFYIWMSIFLLFNIFINEIYVIGFKIFSYGLYIALPFVFFLLLNTFLVGINFNLILMKYRELEKISPSKNIFSIFGTFVALLTGACPGCVAGFFPLFVGFFGSTITLNALPFHGLELQIFSSLLLLIGIYYLSKDLTCEINFKKSN